MSLSVVASKVEGVDANNQDYIVDLKLFSRLEHDDLMTATSNQEVILKADGIAWNSTGNNNRIGGRQVNINGYRQRWRDLHYAATATVRPVVDRWEQFIYICSTNGNNVRKFQGITGSLVETQLFNSVATGNARQGGASNGYEMVYLHHASGLTPNHCFKKRRFDIDVGDVMHTINTASTSVADGAMANNYFDIVVFGRSDNATLAEMMRFQDRGAIKTLPATTHTNGGSNRGGAASYDGHEWYDMFGFETTLASWRSRRDGHDTISWKYLKFLLHPFEYVSDIIEPVEPCTESQKNRGSPRTSMQNHFCRMKLLKFNWILGVYDGLLFSTQ